MEPINLAGTAKAPSAIRVGTSEIRGRLKWLVIVLMVTGCVAQGLGASLPGRVRVITERTGNGTRFLMQNTGTVDMTATLEVGAVNMSCSASLPFTTTVPAGKTMEAFTLNPHEADGEWSFTYTNHYTVGRHDAVHDDSYVYALPYLAGASFKVTQGYHGTFSHTGPDEYAVDWKMPEGTPVLAARDGVVVAVKDDSTKGGAHRKYEDMANMVTVQHSDGTMSHYCHLAGGSAKVQVGKRVRAGELLALSGNTGFTSGPHLHFAVFKARSGFGRHTIPVRFRTADSAAVTLVSGKSYKAADPSPMASAQ